jgi:dolichol-phosphate mannosyltransferase
MAEPTALVARGVASVVVCLPTYNERNHIARLIDEVLLCLPHAYILVIDDASPDGTGAIVAHVAQRDQRVHLLRRARKTGLGDAYRAGFAHALKIWNPRFLVQMDADFSHPVAAIPAMLAQADSSGLVIGSRYVALGGVVRWHRTRRWVSRLGSGYARAWLRLKVADPTSGLRVWQADLLRRVLATDWNCRGYGFQVEAAFIASQLGGHIAEVPFLFEARESGSSKMSFAIAAEALWRIPLLRLTAARKSTALVTLGNGSSAPR